MSVVPSVTETLLAWGVEPVAVTRFCEAPGLPIVGGTKNPDLDSIAALRPDVVVMDKEENREPDARALADLGIRVVATHVRSLADVEPALAVVAEAVGLAAAPTSSGRALPPRPARCPRVWVPIWRRPWMTIGGDTYGSSILEAAGFQNVFGSAPDPYPTVDLDEAGALQPDHTLAPSEPYPFSERHRAELERVAPTVFVDGQDVFWWGARTPLALGRLRQLAVELAGR